MRGAHFGERGPLQDEGPPVSGGWAGGPSPGLLMMIMDYRVKDRITVFILSRRVQ